MNTINNSVGLSVKQLNQAKSHLVLAKKHLNNDELEDAKTRLEFTRYLTNRINSRLPSVKNDDYSSS
jgi:hypothetical protein